MIHSVSWDELRAAPLPSGVPSAHAISDHFGALLPDAQYVALGRNGAVCARCAVWWNSVPPLIGETTSVIGYYAASDEAVARELLDYACKELRDRGCSVAVGPMNGTTWQSYRFVTDAGTEPTFFLEPFNPPEWPAHFKQAGFTELASYFSAVNSDLTQPDPRAEARAETLSTVGVTIRDLIIDDLDAEIQRIYNVSVASFRDNLLYTPIPLDAFAAQYARLRDYLDPRLVAIAEHDGRTVGFAFAIPDLMEQPAGSTRTIIIKTVAILPVRERYAGLGSVLVARTHARAHELGFTRALHALMHESNHSRTVSERTARVIRRYALFGRRLGPDIGVDSR